MSQALGQALHDLAAYRQRVAEQADADLYARLDELRAWQANHVADQHSAHAERHDGQAMLHFLTRTFYQEADWSELTSRPDKVAKRIGRIVKDDRPLLIAVRLQLSADELDVAFAQWLQAHHPDHGLTPMRYVRGFRAVGRPAERRRQLDSVGELVELLGGYADNRTAYWAFKLSASPARALGMGKTYALLAEGFAAMRATHDLENATHQALDEQRQTLERLLA